MPRHGRDDASRRFSKPPATTPPRLCRYLIRCHSAALWQHWELSAPQWCAFLPFILPCVTCFFISKLSCSRAWLQSLFSSPPYAAFSIAYSSPKHQSKPLSEMQKRILITDIWRSRNTAKSLSLRSPQMLWILYCWREGVCVCLTATFYIKTNHTTHL